MSFTDSGIIYYLSKYSECFGEHDRIRYADSEYLRAAGLFAGVRRMRTRQKRGTIRGGALPLLLWFLSFEISPPYLHPAPPRCAAHRLRWACSLTALTFPRCAACGVLAYFCGGSNFYVSVSGFVTLSLIITYRCLLSAKR